ncbi:hypothetical protein ABVL68_07380, partial [Klebsiella pneumoniae]
TVCVVGKMRDLILQLSKSSIYSTKPSADGKLHLVYQRSNPPSPISVWLAVTPKTAGNISLQAVVNDRYSVTWQQFVYP